MTYEQNFEALAAPLPPQPVMPPGLSIVFTRQVGSLLILSGYGPFIGSQIAPYGLGKIGAPGGRTLQDGVRAARLTAINLLLIARQCIGTLDNVVQLVSVEGSVNCTDTFTEQSTVLNGCSNFLLGVFGEAGKHTRSALGTNSLAFGLCVEISMTLVVNPPRR